MFMDQIEQQTGATGHSPPESPQPEDATTQNDHNPPPNKSRRATLKLFATGVGVAVTAPILALLPDTNENTVAGTALSKILGSPTANAQEALGTERLLTKESGEGNLYHKPFFDILKEAVSQFQQQHPNQPVRWQQHADYLGDHDLLRLLLKPIPENKPNSNSGLTSGQVPLIKMIEEVSTSGAEANLINLVYTLLPPEPRMALTISSDTQQCFLEQTSM